MQGRSTFDDLCSPRSRSRGWLTTDLTLLTGVLARRRTRGRADGSTHSTVAGEMGEDDGRRVSASPKSGTVRRATTLDTRERSAQGAEASDRGPRRVHRHRRPRSRRTVTAWQLRTCRRGASTSTTTRMPATSACGARRPCKRCTPMPWRGSRGDRVRVAACSLPIDDASRERAGRGSWRAIGRYVASPRVDSYHGAWFELHEELIGLAGRTRAEEVAAGRA